MQKHEWKKADPLLFGPFKISNASGNWGTYVNVVPVQVSYNGFMD